MGAGESRWLEPGAGLYVIRKRPGLYATRYSNLKFELVLCLEMRATLKLAFQSLTDLDSTGPGHSG